MATDAQTGPAGISSPTLQSRLTRHTKQCSESCRGRPAWISSYMSPVLFKKEKKLSITANSQTVRQQLWSWPYHLILLSKFIKYVWTKKSPLLLRNLWFIHQFYNLLIAYKVTQTRFANILEVARAEPTQKLLPGASGTVCWLLPVFRKGAPESNMKEAWSCGSGLNDLFFLSSSWMGLSFF